jgi:putative ABC transport system permease protein
MRWLLQTFAVIRVNLSTLPARLGSSVVAIVGIAGVVIVFVSVLSISAGFHQAMAGSGALDRALLTREGADSEMMSNIEGPEIRVIKEAPGIRHDGQNPLASAEVLVVIDVRRKASPDTPANVPLRGVEPIGMKVRDEIKIVEGRMFNFGTNEAVVGRAASRQFLNLNIGDTIVSGPNRWQVVGIFDAKGAVAETEIWCDVNVVQGVYHRQNSFQSLVAQLDSAESFDRFHDWLANNPQVNVTARRENEYYLSQSQQLTQLINTLGYGIAALMGIGAVFGAILTMYTAVASRSREIATLRALGFNTLSVLVSVLVESLVIGGIGGLIGAVLAYAAFNGYQTSTMNFQTFSQVAFAFRVTPALIGTGILYALSIGLVGGMLPAIRAARLPISSALREL